MRNVINWFEIYTSDFDRAKKFYTTVFNCPLTDVPMSNERHSQVGPFGFIALVEDTEGNLIGIHSTK